MWWLRVTYPTGRGQYYWGSLDPDIVHAVGRFDVTGRQDLTGVRREMVFSFSTEQAARRARQRVLNLHKKGVRTEVYVYRG